MVKEIVLRKARNNSENLNVSITLIKKLMRPLLLVTLVFGLPLFFLASFLNYFATEGVITDINNASITNIYINAIPTLIAFSFGGLLTSVAIFNLIKLHDQSGETDINISKVWEGMKYQLVPVILVAILYTIVVLIGTVGLIIPGIILMVRLYLSVFCNMDSDSDVFKSFKKSWNYTKGKFWGLFGYIILIAIISYIFQILLGLPAIIYSIAALSASGYDPNSVYDSTTLLVNAILAPIQYFALIFPAVAITVYYFSAKESVEGTGLLEKIASINNDAEVGSKESE